MQLHRRNNSIQGYKSFFHAIIQNLYSVFHYTFLQHLHQNQRPKSEQQNRCEANLLSNNRDRQLTTSIPFFLLSASNSLNSLLKMPCEHVKIKRTKCSASPLPLG